MIDGVVNSTPLPTRLGPKVLNTDALDKLHDAGVAKIAEGEVSKV